MRIIRTRQRPFLVIVDAAFTVLAWAGLLYLLARGLWPLIETHDGPRIEIGMLEALGTLQTYLWVALLNAGVLVLWARYQQRKSKSFARRRLPSPAVDDQRLSDSFKLSAVNFSRMRQPGVMTVHNDEEGGIRHVTNGFLSLGAEHSLHPPLLSEPLER
ncbi:poly-beta-1,6-N-acetyl-D-glucosamine biosynthesis protein PgaD [Pseudomonas chlororaphis]|uniref:Poly-beta-1,6-N-acetyl-D-glucosamine biosynthesis protein PgaD n=1 Tax=Pseudomonas chlororaphis TaxID=587753 RepID=A0A1Q8EX67_9PSED|nr:poly-beta-1,6-N-acetyl-D-glucosamine biosynthesis protein PgaD [Pseudomonas chlororaphis]OLF56388.1 poly-beta-1,6-N-acetyl-D-glucosamine biosynthesis protein PgaD [Pseudomonas chlororaphis]